MMVGARGVPAVVALGEQSDITALEGEEEVMGEAGPMRILVVDDEDVVLTMMRRSLEKAGYEILTARDGGEAVEVFRERGPSISGVVLDLTMPVMGGEETLQALREIEPDLKVLLSSGYGEDEALGQIERYEGLAFIQKPFRPLELIHKAEEFFGPTTKS